MNNIGRYRNNVDKSLKNIKKKSEYFESFGEDFFIAKRIKECLDEIYKEVDKVRDLVVEEEDELID